MNEKGQREAVILVLELFLERVKSEKWGKFDCSITTECVMCPVLYSKGAMGLEDGDPREYGLSLSMERIFKVE